MAQEVEGAGWNTNEFFDIHVYVLFWCDLTKFEMLSEKMYCILHSLCPL